MQEENGIRFLSLCTVQRETVGEVNDCQTLKLGEVSFGVLYTIFIIPEVSWHAGERPGTD